METISSGKLQQNDKIDKKGHSRVIAKLFSLDIQSSKPYLVMDVQRIIEKEVFQDAQRPSSCPRA